MFVNYYVDYSVDYSVSFKRAIYYRKISSTAWSRAV